MPSNRCVVQGCSNKSDPKNGISVHSSPINKLERAKWKRFVTTHRINFEPENRFTVCSEHFEDSCFERAVHVEDSKRILKPGSVPTLWKPEINSQDELISDRSRRQIIRDMAINKSTNDDSNTIDNATGDTTENTMIQINVSENDEVIDESGDSVNILVMDTVESSVKVEIPGTSTCNEDFQEQTLEK
ncbi:THAP domain-containing protein 1-like, partial [Actinia tenebrosa]|uniref:THAP domain-containing protein 1-like n=1 Tax=Actinia tenebrosa TaxID=6105 RepID=A0A6P8HBX5_ACTTE